MDKLQRKPAGHHLCNHKNNWLAMVLVLVWVLVVWELVLEVAC
jgi:hypothetical protein